MTPTGRTGGLVWFDYLVIGCPSCFGVTDYLQVGAGAQLHAGAGGNWLDWMPGPGSCLANVAESVVSSSFEDVGTYVYLESGAAASLPLSRTTGSTGSIYLSQGLGQSDYTKNASYDLVVSDGGSWGAFTVDDAVTTVSGFDSLTPVAMFNDGAQAFSAMSASNLSFTWSPTGVADAVIADIHIFDSSGSNALGRVTCASSDGGAMTVPSSAFGGMPNGALMALYVYRISTQATMHPVTGDSIQASSSFGGVGTGTLRP